MMRTRGFTLVELLATMLVAATLLSLGVPAYTQLRDRVGARAATHRITATLATARSLAVSRRRPVVVCPSTDGRTCRDTTTWPGWIVFVEGDTAGQPASTSDVVVSDVVPESLGLSSTDGRRLVRYLPSGRASGSNVTFSLCSRARSRVVAKVVVNNVGRVRVDHTAGGTCG